MIPYLITAILLTLIIAFIGCEIYFNKTLKVTKYTIEYDNLPEDFDNYKILQISDIHDAKFSKDIITLTRKISPDIIALTGDIMPDTDSKTPKRVKFVKRLGRLAPCYYVPGNHEGYTIKDESKIYNYFYFEDMIESNNINILRDQANIIYQGDSNIQIIGLDTCSLRDEKITEIPLEDFSYKPFTILLTHKPNNFEKISEYDVDLMLCGHTHNGQIKIPFIKPLYVPEQKIFPKYYYGLYSANGTNMIINGGVGTSKLNFRIGCRPEITLITLKKGSGSNSVAA